jgi:hypothetical protein
MKEFISTNISENQIFMFLKQMKQSDRINLFKKFDEDFYTYLFNIEVNKLTINEYNKKLQKSEEDIKNNRVKNQEGFEIEVEEWLKK